MEPPLLGMLQGAPGSGKEKEVAAVLHIDSLMVITVSWSWTNNHILQMEKGRLREGDGR